MLSIDGNDFQQPHNDVFAPMNLPILQFKSEMTHNFLLLQRLMAVFFAEIPKQMKQLTENVKLNQNLLQTQQLLHTIKGDSRTVGALHVAEIASQAEQAAQSGQWPALANLLPQLEQALSQVHQYWLNTTE